MRKCENCKYFHKVPDNIPPELDELHEGNEGTIEARQESVRQNHKGDKAMSELKAVHAFDVYEEYIKTGDDDAAQVYLKSEADKVIARHKYKRCLAMAEKCDARYDEEDAKVNGHAASWEYISKEMKYWERWRNRWLAIAEKFKEGRR